MEEVKPAASVLEPNTPKEKPLVKEFPKRIISKNTILMTLIALAVVLAGVGTGWILSGKTSASKGSQPTVSSTITNTPDEAGITDEKTFRDTAEGTLQTGGIKGEGTHHLDRGTGENQYVYLTSTVIDLDVFVGKKVQVWGETVKGKNAGWLMDVGKIKVIK